MTPTYEQARAEAEESLNWPISKDGPHKINDHRRIMARWLMDSKLDDAEAYGYVAYHPCITDRNKALASRPAVAEGWVLVPRELTREMWAALLSAAPKP